MGILKKAKPWLQTINTVAPTIATALGGPLAGMAVNIVGGILGLEGETEQEITKSLEKAVLGGSPDILLKLKQSEQEFILKLEELGIERDRLDQLDRASARLREVEVKDWIPGTLATVTSLGFFGILIYIIGWGIGQGVVPPEAYGIIGILIGQIGAKTEQVYNYYFGSSAGSRRKNDLLKEQFDKLSGK